MRTPKLTAGDRIAYSARFLRAICDYSHASASLRGTVMSSSVNDDIVEVQWDGDRPSFSMVNGNNLIRADRIHLEPS